MEKENIPTPQSERIDVEAFARRILKVYENELPEDFISIQSNLSDEDDWWDNFRYLHHLIAVEYKRSPALKEILDEIRIYKKALEEKDPDSMDTTFN